MTHTLMKGGASNPGGNGIDGRAVAPPNDYLGKACVNSEQGLPTLGITWHGRSDWVEYEDALFFDAEAIGLDAYPLTTPLGDAIVSIEEFCWVLEPERLCQAITGVNWPGSWAAYLEQQCDAEQLVMIGRHRQFADYFLLQIQVFTAMASNRSYNVIRHFQGCFSYVSLIALSANERLPFQLRAACLDLIQALYINRYPHAPHCGRPSLPELVWVSSEIEAITMSDRNALPRFKLKDGHKLRWVRGSTERASSEALTG